MYKKKRKKRANTSIIYTDVKGRDGGLARAKSLSAGRRSEIARNAANARWKTK